MSMFNFFHTDDDVDIEYIKECEKKRIEAEKWHNKWEKGFKKQLKKYLEKNKMRRDQEIETEIGIVIGIARTMFNKALELCQKSDDPLAAEVGSLAANQIEQLAHLTGVLERKGLIKVPTVSVF